MQHKQLNMQSSLVRCLGTGGADRCCTGTALSSTWRTGYSDQLLSIGHSEGAVERLAPYLAWRVYLAAGQDGEATDEYHRALELRPRNLVAQQRLQGR